ncbi:hypothetical protein HFO27_13440 [Rhizobium leguminosarum]|uniref:hypothetical protein n=1 Tax=Rhizobium leguminosarum TaxID=384 RepID=UPI001C907B2A|nr:hypothetical protein [Rhizobium leguminosarum]MBY3175635.1 hypothetical protein [Rhizobium leguminosarum]
MTDPRPTQGNQAAYAAYKGVSRQTVTDWKKTGLLHFVNGGDVDFVATDKRLADQGIRQPVDADLTDSSFTADGDGLWSKADAETVKENYAARLKQLEYDRESSAVVTIDDAATIIAGEFGLVRDRLRQLGAEISPGLADLTSAAEIKAAIDAAVIEALTDLSAI